MGAPQKPFDFSARQIRVAQLLTSGGIDGTDAGLIIYSASDGEDYQGSFPASMLTGVGKDVYVFVSGSRGSKISRGHAGNGDTGVTMFGGDVVFSGTMYADKMVVELDMSTTGSVMISGSLFVSRSATINQGLEVNKSSGQTSEHDFYVHTNGSAGGSFFRVDVDDAEYGSVFFGDSAKGLNVLLYGSAGPNYVYWDQSDNKFEVHGELLQQRGDATFNEAAGDYDFRAESQSIPGTIVIDSGTDQLLLHCSGTTAGKAGGDHAGAPSAGSDVATYISGSAGSKNIANTKGTTLVTGDLVISGGMALLGAGGGTLELTASMMDLGWKPSDPSARVSPIFRLSSHNDEQKLDVPPVDVGTIEFWGGDSTYKNVGAKIIATPGASWIASDRSPTNIEFWTNDDTTGPIKRSMEIHYGGGVGIGVEGSGPSEVLHISGTAAGQNAALRVDSPFGESGRTASSKYYAYSDKSTNSNNYYAYKSTGAVTASDISQFKKFAFDRGADGNNGLATLSWDAPYKSEGTSNFEHLDHHITYIGQRGASIAFLSALAVVSSSYGLGYNYPTVDPGAQVLILSGTTDSGTDIVDPRRFTDTNFFVSGSRGTRNSTLRGTSVFGGDLVVSGNTELKSSVTINESAADFDFRAESQNIPGAIVIDSGTDQLLLHASGTIAATAGGAIEGAAGSDVATYISGTTESRGISRSKGTTLITGDMALSGTMHLLSGAIFTVSEALSWNTAENVSIFGTANSLNLNSDAFLYVNASSETNFQTGDVNLNTTNGDYDFTVRSGESGLDGMIVVDGGTDQLILHASQSVAIWAGGPGIPAGTDVGIYLSGAIGSAGAANSKGAALFTGDVVVSGSLYGGYVAQYDQEVLKIGSILQIQGSSFYFDGGATDTDTSPEGEDIVFSVSGSIGNKDQPSFEASGGTAVFGGDLVVSGNTYLALRQIEGHGSDLANVGIDVNFFVSGSDGGKISGEGVAVFGGDLQVSGGIYIGDPAGSANASLIETDGTGKLTIDGENYVQLSADSEVMLFAGYKEVLTAYGTGVVVNELAQAAVDFRVETATKDHALFVDAAHDRIYFLSSSSGAAVDIREEAILILSGGSHNDPIGDAQKYTDTNFFVSGSIGSVVNGFGAEQVGNGDLGAAVFGGDVVISGTLFTPASTIYVGGAKLGSTPTGEFLFLSGGAATDPDPANASDANFFVSGAINSIGGENAGTAVFGGDMLVSGNLQIPAGQSIVFDNKNFRMGSSNGSDLMITAGGEFSLEADNSKMAFDAGSGQGFDFRGSSQNFLELAPSGALSYTSAVGTLMVLSGSQSGATSPDESTYTDTCFFVSGAVGSYGTGNRGTALFGGDVVVSGSFFPGEDTASNLGSEDNRWANVYTGDLHLRNEKGSWTIQEDVDRLIVINNMTGKRYKMALEPLGDEE